MEIGRWRLNQFPCVGSLAEAFGWAGLRGDALGEEHLQCGCEMHTQGIMKQSTEKHDALLAQISTWTMPAWNKTVPQMKKQIAKWVIILSSYLQLHICFLLHLELFHTCKNYPALIINQQQMYQKWHTYAVQHKSTYPCDSEALSSSHHGIRYDINVGKLVPYDPINSSVL